MAVRMVLFVLALTSAAPAALAACLDAGSIAKGVVFTRADGRAGFARATGGGIEIDYAAGTKTAWTDRRKTVLGVYENTWIWMPADGEYASGGPGAYYEFARSGKDRTPISGTTNSVTLRTTTFNDNGTENGPDRSRGRSKVTYSFLSAREVTLSGCAYTAIPVELRGANATLIRRWMYFPDLGFGLETRMIDPETGRDRKLGLTSMRAAK